MGNIRQDNEPAEDFALLSRKALSEEDVDVLIELLGKRKNLKKALLGLGQGLCSEELREYIATEKAISRRLRQEKEKVLHEMDTLSKAMKVQKKYVPRASVPHMPVFFDIKA